MPLYYELLRFPYLFIKNLGHDMSNEMKCTNEKMTCNTQDSNLSSYVPKANVDHTISGQGTGSISTLDHLVTTPRAKYQQKKHTILIYCPCPAKNQSVSIF